MSTSGLTPEQHKVLSAILARAKATGASPKQVKAAIETGIVESNLTNPSGGDADSAGWRQERASLYRNPTNLTASIDRFFNETAAVKDRYGRAGDLAAAVQRPAAQYRGRYQQHASEAQALMGGAGVKSQGGSGSRTVTSSKTVGKVDNSQSRAALVRAFLDNGNPNDTAGTRAQGLESRDPLQFALGISQLQDDPGHRVTTTRTVKGSGYTPPSSGGSGRMPTGQPGRIIGTPYAGTHTLGNWQSDNAVDIGVPVGTPMVALQDGVVVKVRHHPQDGGRFAGDQITVRGANGNEYFYAHGRSSVRPGQRIRKGQSLGTTGSANGVAHLHFGQERGDPRMHTKGDR